ncbi:hypothetical protein OIU76_018103 [Salix suchowensis]|nr:hypothetical protein OIU76_018103 [Salix suchowensis]
MFGDCQVMSKMGGNVVSSDTIYSLPVGNPNFNFMSSLPFHTFSPIISKEEDGLVMTGKEEMESGSGCEQLEENSGNEQESSEPPPKKKRYHRHTERQIQQMEAMFKECPHPDDKQRKRLSHELGLHPRQVKFWFQNRRTQMKAQHDRSDNTILRAENESLKNDNYRLQAELRNLFCPDCGGQSMLGELPFEELRLEHARLREELERVCSIASRYGIGRPIHSMLPAPAFVPPSLDLDMSIYSRPFPESLGTCTDTVPMPMFPEPSSFPEAGMVLMEEGKGFAMGLALSSMDELVKMCHAMEPLWIKNNENGKEVLNLEEHARIFPWPSNRKQNSSAVMKTEATRDCAVVIMNSINLVDAFLDANKWMELFPSIVARAKTVQVITTGVCGASGSLHLVCMDLMLQFLIPSPEARVNMMRLAQRMIRTFCLNISTSSGQSWTALPDSYDDTVRITTRKTSEPGQPHRVIISAVSTTWLPYPHFQVFDLLRDEHRRSQVASNSSQHGLAMSLQQNPNIDFRGETSVGTPPYLTKPSLALNPPEPIGPRTSLYQLHVTLIIFVMPPFLMLMLLPPMEILRLMFSPNPSTTVFVP